MSVSIDIFYFRTIPGLLKLAQFVIGIFCMGFSSYPATWGWNQPLTYYLAISVTFFVGTFIQLISSFIATTFLKEQPGVGTVHEVIYNGFATLLFLAAWIAVMTQHQFVVFAFGLTNMILYGASVYYAVKASRSYFVNNLTVNTTSQQSGAATKTNERV